MNTIINAYMHKDGGRFEVSLPTSCYSSQCSRCERKL